MSEVIKYQIDKLVDGEGVFIKAKENDKIVASLLAEVENGGLALLSVNVNEQYRLQGIGSRMISLLKGQYPGLKISGTLLPQAPNLSVQQLAEFYRKNGIGSDGVYRGKIATIV